MIYTVSSATYPPGRARVAPAVNSGQLRARSDPPSGTIAPRFCMPGCGAVPSILSKKVTQNARHCMADSVHTFLGQRLDIQVPNWVRYPMAQLESALEASKHNSASPGLFHRSPHFQDSATPRPFGHAKSRQPILFLPAPGATNWDPCWQAPVHCAAESQSIFWGDSVRPAAAIGRLPPKLCESYQHNPNTHSASPS
jgi:hypothetical protein